MLAVLLTLALFVVWSAFGLAALVAVRADVTDLRVALTAPILGTALTMVPLFMLSNAGVSMSAGALPVGVVLLVGSLTVLVARRPRLPLAAAPVTIICLVHLVLLGRPMFQFGFDWIANANGDMAYYVLSATHLMGHGLQSPVDFQALGANRDFTSSAQSLNLAGLRPGTQIALAGLAAITGRTPIALYMPMSIAIAMCGICAVGSLAMQASRRWWSASVAAALLAVSPMAAYGVMQQLTPQNWGLGLAVALFAWLMRPEMHQIRGARIPDLFVVGVLAVALFVVAYEVAASLALAYVLYVALLAARRRVSLRAVAVLWGTVLVATLIVVNTFLPRAIGYITRFVVPFGTSEGFEGATNFPYALLPTALPGFAGLQSLFATPQSGNMPLAILVAAGLLGITFIASIITGLKGAAAGLTLLSDVLLGILLAKNGNDFGLFKLYMYAQPFLAATVAVMLSGWGSRRALAAASVLLTIIGGAQLRTLNDYVAHTVNPVDLPDASQPDMLPKFRRSFLNAQVPFISVTDNNTLGRLQSTYAIDKSLLFLNRNFFALQWKNRAIDVRTVRGTTRITFGENVDASRVLSSGSCLISLPSGSQLTLNRVSLPEGSPNLVMLPCSRTENLLTFISSSVGQSATLPEDRRAVSFWQLEGDFAYPGLTWSGFGRYALFQVLGPTPSMRAVLSFTTSRIGDERGVHALPPAVMTGAERVRFPVVGSGSARVFSPPLQPRIIGGRPYLVLDMGTRGQSPIIPRPGLTGLWGKSVSLDPRLLTSFVRDVSLISAADFRRLRAPLAIREFPADLANPNLEYSGIYEDGWVSRRAYARLSSGTSQTLFVRAIVLSQPRQHLDVYVDGRKAASEDVAAGALDLQVPVRPSTKPRSIELRWRVAGPLRGGDARQVAAKLQFVGFAPAPSTLSRFPVDLRKPGLVYSGIYDDGLLEKVAAVELAGGLGTNLVVRAQVLPRERSLPQGLRVVVNGRTVATSAVQAGAFELAVPLPASLSSRRVELRWLGTAPLKPPDTRRAAAILEFVGLVSAPSGLHSFPRDLRDRGLIYSGISDDGWLERNVRVVLAGGVEGKLTLRAQVVVKGQRVQVLVNGRTVVSRAVAPGQLELSLPVQPSKSGRQVELRWAKTAPIAPNDPREAAARLQSIAVEEVRAPSQLMLPDDLADPNLSSSGIFKDGWSQRDARLVLAGGGAGRLSLEALVVIGGQRLDVLVNDRTVASQTVEPGQLDVRVPIPASNSARTVELRWAKTAPIAPNDPREAAARLQTIAITAANASAALTLPDDLNDPNLSISGVFKDGWSQRDARFLLAGGAAGGLSVEAQVVVGGQQLEVLVNDRTVASQTVEPGQLDLRVPIPASTYARTVELRWAKTAPIAPNDPRQAAALLQSIAIAAANAPAALRLPDDLNDPNLSISGIFKDGWLEKSAELLLAGGDAGRLELRAQVATQGQRLDIVVNGRRVASRAVKPGQLDLRVPIPASNSARRVELRWAKTASIAANDKRQGAALLQSIAIS